MKFLNKINPQTGYFLFSVLILWLILVLYSIGLEYKLQIFYNLFYYIGDACLIFSPLWLLGRNSRWYSVPAVWLISIYLVASAVYYRYWGELLPLVSIFDTRHLA